MVLVVGIAVFFGQEGGLAGEAVAEPLRRVRDSPVGVVGPVEWVAFSRLARIWAGEAIMGFSWKQR